MIGRTLGLGLILGVLFLTYVVVKMSQDFTSIIPIEQSEKVTAKAESEWLDYTDPEGKFRVELPILPQHAQEISKERHYNMYVSELPNGDLFMITFIRFPLSENSTDDELLSRIVEDMVRASPENVLDSVVKKKVNEWQGVEFSLQNTKRLIFSQAFMKGYTMVVLTGMFDRGTVETQEKAKLNFTRFINSFEVIE